MYITDLPNEILTYIFLYTDATCIYNVIRICKRFDELCGYARFKHNKFRHNYPNGEYKLTKSLKFSYYPGRR